MVGSTHQPELIIAVTVTGRCDSPALTVQTGLDWTGLDRTVRQLAMDPPTATLVLAEFFADVPSGTQAGKARPGLRVGDASESLELKLNLKSTRDSSEATALAVLEE